MNRISKLFAMSTLTILLLNAGCGDDNGGGPSEPGPYDALTLDLYNAGHLANGYFYRVWVANTTTKLASSPALDWSAVAEFNVNPVAGDVTPDVLTSTTGQVISDNTLSNLSVDFEEKDTLMITIEAPGSSSGVPSSTVIAEVQIPGDFVQHVVGGLTFPVDVDSAGSFANTFALTTPTDADTSNELSGVWFANVLLIPPAQTLSLRVAPQGWIYEGWVWHDDTWLSTGKFENAGQSDDFSGYSAGAGIGFPGEDFLLNAPGGVTFPWVIAQGDSVMVTLEPNPDPEPNAQFVIPLAALGLDVDRPALVGNQLFTTVRVSPNGNVTFKRSEEL